jgi:hypothetical protein
MEKMLRMTMAALVCATAALAQNASAVFNKPPEEVDRALRARINEFYEDHVKGQFREAESLVAEDTKDFFYNGNKPRYLSFSIQRIDYSDNFTKAKATLLCEQYVMFPGFTNTPIKIPTPSTWKLVNGQWYWYVDPESLRQSPFGTMTAGTAPASGPVPSQSAIPTTTGFVLNQVKPDTHSVELAPGGSAEVTIANTAPGPMKLSVTGVPPGVEAKLAHPDIPAKDKTTLTLKAGDHAESGTLSITVIQTREVIPIRVTIR